MPLRRVCINVIPPVCSTSFHKLLLPILYKPHTLCIVAISYWSMKCVVAWTNLESLLVSGPEQGQSRYDNKTNFGVQQKSEESQQYKILHRYPNTNAIRKTKALTTDNTRIRMLYKQYECPLYDEKEQSSYGVPNTSCNLWRLEETGGSVGLIYICIETSNIGG